MGGKTRERRLHFSQSQSRPGKIQWRQRFTSRELQDAHGFIGGDGHSGARVVLCCIQTGALCHEDPELNLQIPRTIEDSHTLKEHDQTKQAFVAIGNN